jgi:hypothetical protein
VLGPGPSSNVSATVLPGPGATECTTSTGTGQLLNAVAAVAAVAA